MEHWGNEPNKIHGSIHNPNSFGGTVFFGKKTLYDVSNDFHIYSVNWSPDQIAFLVDDEIYYVYNLGVKDANSWPFNDPQFLLMNVAMGSTFHPIDRNFTESEMLIDYVRVFQNIVGLPEQNRQGGLLIYPQPAKKKVTISGEGLESLLIFNSLGQLVFSSKSKGSEFQLDIQLWPKGIYHIRSWNGISWSVTPFFVF